MDGIPRAVLDLDRAEPGIDPPADLRQELLERIVKVDSGSIRADAFAATSEHGGKRCGCLSRFCIPQREVQACESDGGDSAAAGFVQVLPQSLPRDSGPRRATDCSAGDVVLEQCCDSFCPDLGGP
ncbi:hypothetical protein GCM10023171_25720 [Microbacterium panaciterrae]|uniref:Uncharacterized protein n=1 Tax=Microbacterium panaciterrae TaxID=985759 RepID=A0ABP8PHT3_9MICO